VNELELDPPLATGATVGYARVSTAGQLLDRQLASLTAAGCIRVFADKKSGKNIKREELWKALDFLRPGDTLVVARRSTYKIARGGFGGKGSGRICAEEY
jgi:predicted site-specific integrase-resolvase